MLLAIINHMPEIKSPHLMEMLERANLNSRQKSACEDILGEPALLEEETVRQQISQIVQGLSPVTQANKTIRRELARLLARERQQGERRDQQENRKQRKKLREHSIPWWLDIPEAELRDTVHRFMEQNMKGTHAPKNAEAWKNGLYLLALGRPYGDFFQAMCRRFDTWDTFLEFLQTNTSPKKVQEKKDA